VSRLSVGLRTPEYMSLWQQAGIAFFAYLLLVISARWMLRRHAATRLPLAVGGSILGIAAVLFVERTTQPDVLTEWLWPPAILLLAYWTSGLLFVRPVGWQERMLLWLDDRLHIRAAARSIPRLGAELLEAAYVGVYPLVLAGFLIHLVFAPQPDPARFWAVVLVTDFICFGFLPWIQTRPPRALEPDPSWPSALRAFNLRLLGATSIQVNTFPSGHAAEALAAALLVFDHDVPVPIVAFMFAAALAVAAGAVLGRYHYALDAFTGWIVAIAVYAALR
jgi:membrane-associated phospholipid phosphatase